jgi:hypothetical protein
MSLQFSVISLNYLIIFRQKVFEDAMKRYILSLLISIPLLQAQGSMDSTNLAHEHDIHEWTEKYIQSLSPSHIQVIANFLLFSYTFSSIDTHVRKLNHTLLSAVLGVHTKLLSSTFDNKKLHDTFQYIQQLQGMSSAHQRMLKTWQQCTMYTETIDDQHFQQALAKLQLLGQQKVQTRAEHDIEEYARNLEVAQKTGVKTLQECQLALQVFAPMQDAHKKKVDPIELINTSWQASELICEGTQRLIIDIMPLLQRAEELQNVPCTVLKICYDEVIKILNLEHQKIMFNEDGLIENDKQTPLPKTDQIFPSDAFLITKR